MTEQEFQAVVATMRHWGFAAFTPFHLNSPGHRTLAVAMRPEPSHAHFDPEAMTLVVATPPTGVADAPTPAMRSFHFDTPVDGTHWICPGRVILHDRVGKTVEYYTFGAEMRASRQGDGPSSWLLYVLESQAPIVAVSSALSLSSSTQLVDEVEALFARLRPDERRNGIGLGDELIGLKPNYVYAGCIEALYAKYHRTPVLQHMFPTLFLLLQHELIWVRKQMGGPTPGIHALLRNPPSGARRVDRPPAGTYTNEAN